MTANRNNGAETGAKPGRAAAGRFGPGNPGRPKGARHKSTLAAEAMLEGEAKKITRKAIDMAKAGDSSALRLCFERIVPLRRDRAIRFTLDPVNDASDHPKALAAVLAAVADGELSPAEAQAFASVLGEHRKALDAESIERRLAALEQGRRA